MLRAEWNLHCLPCCWLAGFFCPPTHTFPLFSLPPQALTSAKATISSLAQQQRDLELRRRANLAFSGQTLVGDNLNVLQVGRRGMLWLGQNSCCTGQPRTGQPLAACKCTDGWAAAACMQ